MRVRLKGGGGIFRSLSSIRNIKRSESPVKLKYWNIEFFKFQNVEIFLLSLKKCGLRYWQVRSGSKFSLASATKCQGCSVLYSFVTLQNKMINLKIVIDSWPTCPSHGCPKIFCLGRPQDGAPALGSSKAPGQEIHSHTSYLSVASVARC